MRIRRVQLFPVLPAALLTLRRASARVPMAHGFCTQLNGPFGETALHWAAILGEDRLVSELQDRK